MIRRFLVAFTAVRGDPMAFFDTAYPELGSPAAAPAPSTGTPTAAPPPGGGPIVADAIPGHLFACRCFCGVRDYAFNATTNTWLQRDDSYKLAFDPEPIFVASANALAGVATHDRISKWANMGGGLKEFLSVVAVERPALLSAVEARLFANFRQLQPQTADAITKLITELVKQLTGEALDPLALVLKDPNSASSPATVRFTSVTAEMAKTPFGAKAVCVKQCKDDVLGMSIIAKKFIRHFDFGVLKSPTETPAGTYVTPEKPEWGLPFVEVPAVQNLPRNTTWEARMAARYEALYHIAAKFVPKQGFAPAVVTPSGRTAMNAGLCSQLHASLDAGQPVRVGEVWPKLDAENWHSPYELRAAELLAAVHGKPYVTLPAGAVAPHEAA